MLKLTPTEKSFGVFSFLNEISLVLLEKIIAMEKETKEKTAEIIRELKDLMIAYECAINYDYVPDVDQVDELINEILPSWISTTKKELEAILEKYSGSSPNNIINLIIDKINTL